jgi:hypothetical protein
VRASRQTGAEVVALSQEDFNDLLAESAATRSELDRVADERKRFQDRLTSEHADPDRIEGEE